LTSRAILAAALAMPFQALTVLGGIHWEAFRLWLKGVRLLPSPPRPASPVSIQKRPAVIAP
jgi:DUF1365 family protein